MPLQFGPEGPPRSTLEVINRTPELQQISFDGWVLGTVQSGERTRFRRLRPGVYQVSARSVIGTTTDTLTFLRGQVIRWSLKPKSGDALPIPAAFAHITLVNRAKRSLIAYLDGEPERTIFDGDSQQIWDVRPGHRTLTIAVPGSRYRRDLPLPIQPQARLTVKLAVEVGVIKVTNNTGERVQLLMDGLSQPSVADAGTHLLQDVLVGVRKLQARGLRTGREYAKSILIAKGEALEWDLSASVGQLEVQNRSGETLHLEVDGRDMGLLADGQSKHFERLALGHRRITATGKASRYQWNIVLPLSSGQAHRWAVRNNVGTAFLTNQLSESVQIQVDGQRIGRLDPGQSAFFDELKSGPRLVRVFGETSLTIQERHLVISPATTAQWRVMAPQARMLVKNQSAEAVLIYCDGKPVGRVKSAEEMVFTQLPPGEHLIEARGEISNTFNRSTLELTISATATWNVATQSGIINIHNESGETLIASPTLRPQAKQVEHGASGVYRIPVGNRILHFIGAVTKQSYFHRFAVAPQSTHEWNVGALEGFLHIFNRTAESQSVSANGIQLGEVPAAKEAIITLRTGAHRLIAVGRESRQALEGTVVVFSGVTRTWEIQRKLSNVRITNNTAEILDLRLNGLPLGFLEANQSRVYGPMTPGRQQLSAQGRWSHAIYENNLNLKSSQIDHWQIEAAQGRLLVSNRRNEVVRVLLDEKEHSEVPANSQMSISAPLGPHLIELVGRDSHAIFTHRIRVRPDRSYTLNAPQGPALLSVINRLKHTLSLRINERHVGTVAAGQKARFRIQERGKIIVFASLKGKVRSWHRSFELNDERILHWVIGE